MLGLMPALPERLRSLASCAAAALLVLAPAQGFAQYGKTLRNSPTLTRSDIAIIRKIVREDFTGQPNGTTRSWNNPESRNSGTVKLLDNFPSRGRECRRVQYFVKPGPGHAPEVRPSTYVLTSCRLSDGTWQLDSEAKRDDHAR